MAGTNINPGASLFPSVTLGNFAAGGAIGTAAATVDNFTHFNIPQTTAAQTLSLPNPTDTSSGRWVLVSNTGSTSFTLLGIVVAAGASLSAIWTGAAWSNVI